MIVIAIAICQDLQESSRPAVGAVAELLQLLALSVVVDVRLLKNTVEPLT